MLATAPVPTTQAEALALVSKIHTAALKVRSIHMENMGDDAISRWLHRTLFPYTAPSPDGGLPYLVSATAVPLDRDYITGGELMNILWMVEKDDLVRFLLMINDVALPPFDPHAFVRYLGVDEPPQLEGANDVNLQ